jgi:hypothetical protein
MSHNPPDHLAIAAEKAGITREQAAALIEALMVPSRVQVEVGREFRSLGTFQLPSEDYEGLSWMGWLEAHSARQWMVMAAALLSGYSSDPYEGPMKRHLEFAESIRKQGDES